VYVAHGRADGRQEGLDDLQAHGLVGEVEAAADDVDDLVHERLVGRVVVRQIAANEAVRHEFLCEVHADMLTGAHDSEGERERASETCKQSRAVVMILATLDSHASCSVLMSLLTSISISLYAHAQHQHRIAANKVEASLLTRTPTKHLQQRWP